MKTAGRVGVGLIVILGFAVEAIGGDEELPAPERLIEALRSPDAETRYRASEALWRLGLQGKEAVPALAAALRDPEVRVRRMAAQALCGMGRAAEVGVLDLGAALEDKDGEVRRWAALALWRLGPKAEPALPHILESLIRISERETCEAMLETVSLIRTTDPGIRKKLLYYACRKHLVDERILRRAMQSAWPPGPERDGVIQVWTESLRSSDPDLRGAAGEYVRAFGAEALRKAKPLLEPAGLLFNPRARGTREVPNSRWFWTDPEQHLLLSIRPGRYGPAQKTGRRPGVGGGTHLPLGFLCREVMGLAPSAVGAKKNLPGSK